MSKGRVFRSSFLTSEQGWKSKPGFSLPRNIVLKSYDPPKSPHPDEEPTEEQQEIGPLKVKKIDLNISNNTINHKTDAYDITKAKQDGKDATPQLVVRRAQEFTVTLTFDRDIDLEKDQIQIVFEIGDNPIISKGTEVVITPERVLRPRHWSSSIQSQDGAKLAVAVLTPPDCFVGKWQMSVNSSWKSASKSASGKTEILRYKHTEPIYMLLNPFCKDDTVYMDNEVDLDEYVINDTGKLYNGNYKQLSFKPWSFGQFENPVLECAMFLLEKSRLNLQSCGNPVSITRALMRMINCQDDNGVLIENWSGSYEEGTAPSHWTGSVAILQKYFESREAVKYGQCWVFSGVLTSVLRSLGLPTRSVTNYSSAHDCDGSMSVDLHWNEKGNPLDKHMEDFVWNFHVWNESWMARPDLEAGLGGWQAFDATPQETSDGLSCAGPAPVCAIKQGNVNLPFDAPFIFAEVNADKIHWILNDDGTWSNVVQKNIIGKKISTKRPRNEKKETVNRSRRAIKDDEDRLDITDQYKYEEGTETQRAAVLRANRFSTRSDIHDKREEDVKFILAQKDEILVGNSFDVILKIVNKSRLKRTVHVVVSLETVYYTGVHAKMVKSKEFKVELQAIKTEEAVMRILAEEYLNFVVDQVSFKINVLAKVKETNQIFADSDDFRLRRPDLVLECPSSVTVGQPFKTRIKFQNSLPEHLTNCEWMVEGPGLQRVQKYPQKNLEPYDRAELEVMLTPQRPGPRQLIASFTSKELTDVTGLLDIDVKE